ncbi:oxysterol binding protein [Ceratobasidium sp. AG-Ba]|nr:oxysterol binding protein [Ceratobasidium sp. AG-Ba]
MSPLLGAVDLSRARSTTSVISTRRHSMATLASEASVWFDAPEGGDEFFLDEKDPSEPSYGSRHSDVEEEDEEDEAEGEIADDGESSLVSTNQFSVLQRLAEDVEYVNLLAEAASTSDPVDRIALVAAFAVSGYACTLHRASRKPFNPMLGETFEDTRLGFIAEKVSHHPPIMACHAQGEGWEFWCTSGAKNKFWGKSLEIIPMGAAHVKIGEETYSWQKPSSFMRNLIAGNRYLEHVGPMSITSTSGFRCELDFKEGGFWGSTLNHVAGAIHSANSKTVSKLEGTWHEGMSQHLDSTGSRLKVLWRPHPFPSYADQYYGFTSFAITLNEITPDVAGVLPPTDSRLRPDQRAMEEGRIDEADELKIQVEEAQRARKRERDAAGETWTPQWFDKMQTENGNTRVAIGRLEKLGIGSQLRYGSDHDSYTHNIISH